MNYLNFASLTNLFGNNTTSSSLLSTFGSYILNGSFGSSSIFGGSGLYSGYGTTGSYNHNGYNLDYNAAGRARSQQNTAVMMGILSMILPSAATMLKGLIEGLAEAQTPPDTSPKSSVTDNLQKQNNKSRLTSLENDFLNYDVQSKLLDGDSPANNLKEILKGESINIPKDSTVKENGVKDLQSKLTDKTKAHTSGVKFGDIKNDSTGAEGKTYLQLSDDAKTVFDKFKSGENSNFDVDAYTTSKPTDGKYNLQYIKEEKGHVDDQISNIKKALDQYDAFSALPDFTINDLGDATAADITVGTTTYKYQASGYPDAINNIQYDEEKTNAQTQYDKSRKEINSQREQAVKTINEKLKTAKETAKKEAEKLKEQQQVLEEYQTNLDEIELADPDALNNNEYLMQLSNGQKVKTAGDLLKLKEKEQEEAYQILADATGKSVEYLKALAKDGALDSFITDNSTSITAQQKKITDKQTQTETDLQLLNFATEKYGDLASSSDITRAQHNKLQAKARELLNNQNLTYEQKQQQFKNYATSIGISMGDFKSASEVLSKNGKKQANDTNNNGIKDNWTTSVKDGVDIQNFVKINGFNIEDVKTYLGNSDKETISGSEAEKVIKAAGEKYEDFKSKTHTRFGDLESIANKYTDMFNFDVSDTISDINTNYGDDFLTHISNKESTKINNELEKGAKEIKQTVSKIEKTEKQINTYLANKGYDDGTVAITSNNGTPTYKVTYNGGKVAEGTDFASIKDSIEGKNTKPDKKASSDKPQQTNTTSTTATNTRYGYRTAY